MDGHGTTNGSGAPSKVEPTEGGAVSAGDGDRTAPFSVALSRRSFLTAAAVAGLAACTGSEATTGGGGTGTNSASTIPGSTTGASATPGSTASTQPALTTPVSTLPGPATSVSVASTTPPSFDPTLPFWQQGGFAAVSEELTSTDLVVRGEIPASLNGLYVRNGSNPVSGVSNHWFFGDGMVHGVTLADGRATSFRNRWVRTKPFNDGAEMMDGVPGGENGEANVSVFYHGGRLLASGEAGWTYELAPSDLSTNGFYNFDPNGAGTPILGPNVTAHPKIDPRTGYLHFFGHNYFEPFLEYYVADPSGVLVHRRVIERDRPTMIHDFAITDRDVVFWDFPAVFSLDAVAAGEKFPFIWQPEHGSQVGVMPLWTPDDGAADSTQPRWIEIENGYVFHGTNAWRDGDAITVDVSWQPEFAPLDPSHSLSVLRRWTIDAAAGTCREEQLDEIPMDLPTIDGRELGMSHRRSYYVNFGSATDEATGAGTLELNGVIGRDNLTGATDIWRPGPARQPTEALFVAEDGSDPSNTDGWLLSYVWNRAEDFSTMVILNSTDISAGPVAEIDLPQRVPFGFHGTWVPAV